MTDEAQAEEYVLIEFASAVDAVECAVQLQQAMESANAGLSEDRRIRLRIGIHLGDVMVEGSDLYGDGVNESAKKAVALDPEDSGTHWVLTFALLYERLWAESAKEFEMAVNAGSKMHRLAGVKMHQA